MDEAVIVKQKYDKDSLEEWNRLDGFHFEFEITKVMLNRYMKKGKILDIGGGPGRYSLYLAALGFDVTLVDLSDGNIAFAKAKAKELGLNIKAYQCDARDLSKLNLGLFDTVLLMGPLYHLFKESDRAKCVKEAIKHMNSDAVLFASFISLQAGINFYLDECPSEIIHESQVDFFDNLVRNETWSGPAFTMATFIENSTIEPFFSSLGFEEISLFGQEGITGTRLSHLIRQTDEVKKFYLDLSVKLCENHRYFSYSNHLMYVGKLGKK